MSGTFKALMASTGTTAASRFSASGPWVRPDGVSVGALAQFNMTAPAPILISPTLHYYGLVGPWTGAPDPSMAGTAATTCAAGGGASWTAPTGNTAITGRAWNTDYEFFQQYYNQDCAIADQIYCLQQ